MSHEKPRDERARSVAMAILRAERNFTAVATEEEFDRIRAGKYPALMVAEMFLAALDAAIGQERTLADAVQTCVDPSAAELIALRAERDRLREALDRIERQCWDPTSPSFVCRWCRAPRYARPHSDFCPVAIARAALEVVRARLTIAGGGA